jgi:uncharacterized protein YjbJ (UPF0337 family)
MSSGGRRFISSTIGSRTGWRRATLSRIVRRNTEAHSPSRANDLDNRGFSSNTDPSVGPCHHLTAEGRCVIHEPVTYWSSTMNKDQVKGTAEKVKGKVNEAIGRATHNTKQEVKGDLQQAAGQARKNLGDAKESVKKT